MSFTTKLKKEVTSGKDPLMAQLLKMGLGGSDLEERAILSCRPMEVFSIYTRRFDNFFAQGEP